MAAPQSNCRHPMKQSIDSRKGRITWWCPTCEDVWHDPDKVLEAEVREDRVPANAELPPKRS
jgi:hypothetical protein